MSLATDKKEIIKRLKDTNEEWVIKSIKKLLDVPDDYITGDDEIVGYVGEEPLTKYQLRKDLKEGEKEFERGEYMTSDELKKEIKTWRSKK